jgi:hypothetical protein
MQRLLSYLIIILLLFISTSCAGRSASWVDYRRSGGFLGLDDHLVIDENGNASLTRGQKTSEYTLDSQTITNLKSIFSKVSFSELQHSYLPTAKGADLIDYEITYLGYKVHTMDTAVPTQLSPVIDALNQIIVSGEK